MNIENERIEFEKEYLKFRKLNEDERYSINIGDDASELLTRNGTGYLYGNPQTAWHFWTKRASLNN